MEPQVTHDVLSLFLYVYAAPFAGFAFGVLICDRMKLHSLENRANLWLISVPVALVTVATMVSSTRFHDEAGDMLTFKYAHIEDPNQFLMFLGIIIIMGTLVPASFDRLRDQFRGPPTPPAE